MTLGELRDLVEQFEEYDDDTKIMSYEPVEDQVCEFSMFNAEVVENGEEYIFVYTDFDTMI